MHFVHMKKGDTSICVRIGAFWQPRRFPSAGMVIGGTSISVNASIL